MNVLKNSPAVRPSRQQIRQAAAAIRSAWSDTERQFRREVGQFQRRRLVATLVRSAA